MFVKTETLVRIAEQLPEDMWVTAQEGINPNGHALAPNTYLVQQILEAADKAGYKLEVWCDVARPKLAP
jgi:hypothetical protein